MQALRVWRHGEPAEALRVEDVPAPEPGADEVLVEVRAAAIGLPDLLLGRGTYQLRPPLPFTPGLEAAGPVVALGPGADPGLLGRRVVGVPALPSGALAELTVIPARNAFPVPDAVDDATAAASHIAHLTAHVALHRRAGLQPGQTLVVHAAAGGTGAAAVQLGALAGARVLATAGSDARVAVARDLGAHVAINYRTDDFVAAVLDATGGRGADVVFDPVGGDVFRASQRCVAAEGTILVVGFAGGEVQQIPAHRVLLGNHGVLGVYLGAYSGGDDNRAFLLGVHDELMRCFADGRVRPLVSRRVGLDGVAAALEALRDREVVGRVLVLPG